MTEYEEACKALYERLEERYLTGKVQIVPPEKHAEYLENMLNCELLKAVHEKELKDILPAGGNYYVDKIYKEMLTDELLISSGCMRGGVYGSTDKH